MLVRVLLVDDEPQVLRAVQRMLERDHTVVGVHSALEALARIEAGEEFDVLVTDYHLPDKTGAELIALLRWRAPQLADHALIMTGGAERSSVRMSVHGVGAPLLAKPFSRSVLAHAIDGLFAPQATAAVSA
jgi:CheY-like chemotaxis protein